MEIARLKEELIQQRKSKFKGNIYHYSQVNFAYNSNKIEGGRLSEDETEEICSLAAGSCDDSFHGGLHQGRGPEQ